MLDHHSKGEDPTTASVISIHTSKEHRTIIPSDVTSEGTVAVEKQSYNRTSHLKNMASQSAIKEKYPSLHDHYED